MSPRDSDGDGGTEATNRAWTTGSGLDDDRICEHATEHLWEAVSATETAEKQFHVREALQLLRIDDQESRRDERS